MVNRTLPYRGRFILTSSIVIACVVLVIYAPALHIGFRLLDDYDNVYRAGTMPLQQYLSEAVDPQVQNLSYRPVGLVALLVAYDLFHADASYYHLMQIMIHLGNALLIFGIIRRLGQGWRGAFLAALFFASFPLASEAVFWISDQSPLATFFSLAAILCWIDYLHDKKTFSYILTNGALALALLSRESAVVIPAVFFIVDRLIVCETIDIRGLIRRYLLIGIITLIYLGVEYSIQRHGFNVSSAGFSFGVHIVTNYVAYWGMLFSPWGTSAPFGEWLVWVLGFSLVAIVVLKRSKILAGLVLIIFVSIGPVVLLSIGAWPRYLYLASAPMAVLLAILFLGLLARGKYSRLGLVASILVASTIFYNGSALTTLATEYYESAREIHVPFRTIMQQHPTFPNNSRLFLIEPPFNTIPNIRGMFFLQYGTAVSVGGTYKDGSAFTFGRLKAEPARLRDYSAAYVYYFDRDKRPIEVEVDQEAFTRVTPGLPRSFEVPIRLEGYELSSSRLKKGQPLALFLYWRATGKVQEDYTIFLHLVNSNGEIVAGDDSMPRDGNDKTSTWNTGHFTVDGHVLVVPKSVPAGQGYHIEIGMYYQPTMQRLLVMNDSGLPLTDKFEIAPFEIVE